MGQSRRRDGRHPRAGGEERPGVRPHGPQRHDHEENRNVEEVRERSHVLAPGFLQLVRHFPLLYWTIDQVGTVEAVRATDEWRPAKTLEDAVANPVKGQTLPRRG